MDSLAEKARLGLPEIMRETSASFLPRVGAADPHLSPFEHLVRQDLHAPFLTRD